MQGRKEMGDRKQGLEGSKPEHGGIKRDESTLAPLTPLLQGDETLANWLLSLAAQPNW